jgi:hypothetical protein
MTGYFNPSTRAMGRYCRDCGASLRLHGFSPDKVDPWGAPLRPCPEQYRPSTLDRALVELQEASDKADPAAIFTARGNVQHLLAHRPGTCLPMCDACDALLRAAI